MKPLIFLAVFAAVFAQAAQAQHGAAPLVLPAPEAMEVAMLRISATSRCGDECVVRGAPYSAERHYSTEQLLADGNRIRTERLEKIYRDARGRTRVESQWLGRPLVQIHDPVAGLSYRLYPDSRSGLVMRIREPQPASGTAPATLAGAGSAGAAKVAQQLAPALASAGPEGETDARLLGAKVMEGVPVNGKLHTTTVPAGAAGNALPIVASSEVWSSPELRLPIYARSADPRTGERITRITGLNRQDPPSALFTPPSGYTVREVVR